MTSNCKPMIEEYMRRNMLFIIGQGWCGFTRRAVTAAPDVPVIYLDQYADGLKVLSSLQRHYNHRTVPMIFKGREFLGGSEYFA